MRELKKPRIKATPTPNIEQGKNFPQIGLWRKITIANGG
jgi:hypothetical protein